VKVNTELKLISITQYLVCVFRYLCIVSLISGSMTVTHDPYDPSEIVDPFDS